MSQNPRADQSDGGGGPASAEVRGGPRPHSLESHANTVPKGLPNLRQVRGSGGIVRTYTQVCSVRCKSWFCPTCCQAQGPKLRKRLYDAWLADLRHPFMITLTLDPRLFPEGPERAYRHVLKTRALAKTMDRLSRHHSGKFFAAVEWQENGWPHWHVIIDSHRVPIEEIRREWGRFIPRATRHLVRDTIRSMGMVRFTADVVGNPLKALRYVTKYVIKPPKSGFPKWLFDMIDAGTRVRRFTTSRGFWGELTHRKDTDEQVDEDVGQGEPEQPRKRRTLAQRLRKCCTEARVMHVRERADLETGELKRERVFLGKLTAPVGNVMDALERIHVLGPGGLDDWWRKGWAFCHAGSWFQMRETIKAAWELAGHVVIDGRTLTRDRHGDEDRWTGQALEFPILRLSWQEWTEPDGMGIP